VAELSIQAMINDDRWVFVDPLLPSRRRRPRADGQIGPRAVLAAIVYAVTTKTSWEDLPDEFGVTPATAQRRFGAWTDVDLWRQLAVAASGTPHARWARTVADAAIHRAGNRAHGYPDPYPKGIPDEVDEPTCIEPSEPELPPRHTRPSTDEFTEARRAMNRPDGIALL
jgi:transposase